MNQMRNAILELDSHNLPLQRNLSDAFATVCRFFGHTAKPVSEAFALDKKQAVNALEGKAGGPSITRALLARQNAHDDHYDVALTMLALIFGETHDQYEERKLQRAIEESTHAITTLEARRKRRQELRSFSPADDSGLDRRRA